MSQQSPIVFFDGVCGLCNAFIDWIFKVDKSNKIKVAALQGETAKSVIPPNVLANLNTVVVFIDGELFYQSTGVLKLASFLPWYYRPLQIFLFLPKAFRNRVYDWVAKNRYKWFGKKETCRLPTAEERAKFLP